MSKLVVTGAKIRCSFGAAIAPFSATPGRVTASHLAVGTMNDTAPGVNVPSFGTCTSASHPVMASSGSPGPCAPPFQGFASPWAGAAAKVKVGQQSALLDRCKLTCVLGGLVEVGDAGQAKANGK